MIILRKYSIYCELRVLGTLLYCKSSSRLKVPPAQHIQYLYHIQQPRGYYERYKIRKQRKVTYLTDENIYLQHEDKYVSNVTGYQSQEVKYLSHEAKYQQHELNSCHMRQNTFNMRSNTSHMRPNTCHIMPISCHMSQKAFT